VATELAFVVGPRRNWMNLWKPTIDALEPLLGRTQLDRSWHTRDGRIVELALHCTIEQTLRNEVLMEIAARTLPDAVADAPTSDCADALTNTANTRQQDQYNTDMSSSERCRRRP
jgi:hypothetical protein